MSQRRLPIIRFLLWSLGNPIVTEAQQLSIISMHKIPEGLKKESGESAGSFLPRAAAHPRKGTIKWLDLRGGNLHTIPEFIKEYRQLEQLNLSGNQIRVIPACLDAMPRLRGLNIYS